MPEETARRYRDVIASIDGIVWESDARTHRTTLVSDGAIRVLGYPLERWTDDPNFWQDSMFPDDIDRVVRELNQVIADNAAGERVTREITYRMIRADGRVIWLQSTVSVVMEDGEPKLLRGISLDITQRKLRELRIAEEERFIKGIADNLPAVLTYWNRDLRCAYANQSVTDWFGRDPRQMIGVHMRDQLGEELFALDLPYATGVLAGKAQQFERTLTRADGTTIQVVAQYAPDIVDGEVRGFFALVSDVTSIKRQETQLRLLEKSVAGLTDIVIILETSEQHGGEPRIVYVNDAFERQLGYPRDEVMGCHPGFLLGDRTSAERRAEIRASLAAGQSVQTELINYRRDGNEVPVDINITPLTDAAGRVTHIVAILRDITERQREEREKQAVIKRLSESESFANLVLQHVDAIVIVHDRDGNLLRANRKAELLTGYSEAELKQAEIYARLFLPEEIEGVQQVRSCRDVSAFPITHINHWISRSGEKRLLRWANVASIDETGTLAFIIAIGLDITDLRRHEQALIAAKNQAETANRAKSSFLATMSHELRTPLNAIIGFSDVMAQQSFGPIENKKYVEYLNDIRNSGRQLLSIINDILDLSRVEAGKQDLKIEPVTLADAWPLIAGGLEATASAKGIDILVPARMDDLAFMADRRAVMQVLTNLVSNSIKFTASGGRVHLEQHASANPGYVVLAVRDTGRGIPTARLKDVLKPFVQVSNTYSRDAGGVGLGLAICNGLVTSMHGHIDITSEIGEGTIVSVHLPVASRPPLISPDMRAVSDS